MRWTLNPIPKQEEIEQLKKELQIDSNIAKLLIQRGISNFNQAKQFFRPSLKMLHDPFLMKDMDKAVTRLELAIKNKENILVYGDYDVDGTTAVALVASFLKSRSEHIATYIPDRYSEGYGISYKGIDFAHDNDFTLIIALDCGIKAMDKVLYAKEKNIDFIICDHHRPGEVLPDAIAVLDPKRSDCNYPYKELCGCGVGFKLIQAFASKEGESIDQLIKYLDLVATAIAADIVPITGENRILSYFGLDVINSNPRPGIETILRQVNKEEFTITDVVFIVAPRINAAGRMKHGNHAVTLLMETDYNLAAEYAVEVDQFNTERKDADSRITQEALKQIEEQEEQERFTTVVYNENWHKGVIGIVASRLTETYYRPTLVFTKSGDKLTASARSVKGFDVYNALNACSELIEQFGGHKYAAGLTINEDNYKPFKRKFEQVVADTIDETLLTPELKIDSILKLEEVTPRFYRILKQFAPFGPGNMTPIFVSEDVYDTGFGKCVGEEGKHLKLTLNQDNNEKVNGIGFGLGDKFSFTKNRNLFKVAYSIDENHWNGNVTLQLKIKDIKL